NVAKGPGRPRPPPPPSPRPRQGVQGSQVNPFGRQDFSRVAVKR
ncbi:hypothetical protein QMO42_30965, partial [Pseudomonas aeruginosa]